MSLHDKCTVRLSIFLARYKHQSYWQDIEVSIGQEPVLFSFYEISYSFKRSHKRCFARNNSCKEKKMFLKRLRKDNPTSHRGRCSCIQTEKSNLRRTPSYCLRERAERQIH